MHANSEQAWNWDTPMEPCRLHQSQQLGEGMSCEKEPMFEKQLTPSDVGKLNRLVIPKQYAEKYFPLDAEAGEKGLLLSFEDENGKQWRFRYSYWTSSQSYVLTKGWSRFVKEKRLYAGDAVLFLRRPSEGDRLYIGCRRRGNTPDFIATSPVPPPSAMETAMQWNPDFCNSASLPSSSCLFLNSIPQAEQQRSSEEAAAAAVAAAGKGNSKRLRLFGVNLECGHLFPAAPQIAKASGHHIK